MLVQSIAILLAIIEGIYPLTCYKRFFVRNDAYNIDDLSILIGATIFSSVFRGFGGEDLIESFLTALPGGILSATFIVMVCYFCKLYLDFLENYFYKFIFSINRQA